MNTIKETIENTLIIKNSRFITIIYNINDINDIDLLLTNCHINSKNYQDIINYNVDIYVIIHTTIFYNTNYHLF